MASKTRRHTLLASHLDGKDAAIRERDKMVRMLTAFGDPEHHCIGYECDQQGAYSVWLYEYVAPVGAHVGA